MRPAGTFNFRSSGCFDCQQESEDMTEYENPYDNPEIARASKLIGQITDEHTRALDMLGWMIVQKPDCEDPSKWPCGDPAPSWCARVVACFATAS
jgi:hypothetical protein